MHLITIRNKKDASAIAHAVSTRFTNYTVRTFPTDFQDSTYDEHAIHAEYNGKKRLTQGEANIAMVLIPAYAQAYYAGLVYGKQEALIEAKASIQDMLELANPHHPRHDKARE